MQQVNHTKTQRQIEEKARIIQEADFTDDVVVNRIIAKHIARSRAGMKKYGASITANNTKDNVTWLDEAIEECLDQAVYLEKLRDVIQNG